MTVFKGVIQANLADKIWQSSFKTGAMGRASPWFFYVITEL